MNYFAHLHIAHYCQSDLAGNLLGDFVKGNPEGLYPPKVVDGIRLHRFVDSYIDSHPITRELKTLFPAHLRRYSLIALDMMWDHVLLTHWLKFAPIEDDERVSLGGFCKLAQRQTVDLAYAVPEHYLYRIEAMWEGNWIDSYRSIENICFALKQMSKRSARMSPLAECGEVLVQHYIELEKKFLTLYPQVLNSSYLFATK